MSKATVLVIVFTALFCVPEINAQSTEFSYQGSLRDGVNPANANYDLEFRLYDAITAGTQIGPLLSRSNVPVVNGIFSTNLDFDNVFPGNNRFLEIRVRTTGFGSFILLSPRQQVNSVPYSVQSLNATNATTATSATSAATAATAVNATQLGGIVANQYVLTGDLRLSDARNPLPGSSSYIQNQNAAPQATSNFDISGTGTANIFNATTQFHIGGSRVLSNAGANNIFAGANAGQANTTGEDNSFFGGGAGAMNSAGSRNSFFGALAGVDNTSGQDNSFFGRSTGLSNTLGSANSYFGAASGLSNTTGAQNSFFGQAAGRANTTGGENAFFGEEAGLQNTSGSLNSYFGSRAGRSNFVGIGNTMIGYNANVGVGNLTNASALGSHAFVTQSNSIVLGAINGVNTATVDTNVGIGTTTPSKRLHIKGLGDQELMIESGDLSGRRWSIQASSGSLGGRFEIVDRTANEGRLSILNNGSVGIGTSVPSSRLHISAAGGNIVMGDPGCSAGFAGIGFGSTLSNCNNYSILGNGTHTIISRPTGGVIEFREGNNTQVSVAPGGLFAIANLGTGGSVSLCRNGSDQISTCSSSLRYKSNIGSFNSGLDLIKRIRPITFDWKNGGMHDLGLGAEDVAAIEPLLVTYNKQGQVEGVKYDRIGVVLVNAVKEQQAQIERLETVNKTQQQQIDRQQAQIEELMRLTRRPPMVRR